VGDEMNDPWDIERREGETDSTYFMRIYRAAEKRYPWMEERLLHLGACLTTGLDCMHPVNCQAHHSILGDVPILEFLDSEPPGRLNDPEYRARIRDFTSCTVCGTHGLDGPTPVERFWK
jgi:hypothetical protein